MVKYRDEVRKLIPENFCLDNYTKSSSLDLKEWFDSISDRAEIESYLSGYEDPFHAYTDQEVIDIIDDNMIFGFGSKIKSKNPLVVNIHELLINSMTVSDIESVSEDIRPYEFKEKYINYDINDYSRFARMGIAFASVDLNAPDEILMKSFVEWLQKTRLKHGSNPKQKSISNSLLRRWQSNKVIEYIDLSQWYRIRNKKLYDHQAASILFPNDVSRDTKEVVTKTIRKKLVPEILSKEVRLALLSQRLDNK